MTTQDLKKRNQHWKKQWDFAVLAKNMSIKSLRYPKKSYSKQNKNKPRDNSKHLAHYILS